MTVTDQRFAAPVLAETTLPSCPTDPLTAVRLSPGVARCAVEVVRAQRPATSIARLVTPEVLDMLERRASLTRRLRGVTPSGAARPATGQMTLGRMRTCVVHERAVEASTVVHEPGRARFLAMRWELRHTGWKVTVLELG